MNSLITRLLPLALVLLSVAGASTEPPKDEPFDYRRFLQPPTTTPEYWEAMQFEMEVGRFDLAAGHLREMLKKKPTPEELLALHQKFGMATFLRLLAVPRWYEKRDQEAQAHKDVQDFINLVTDAVRTKLNDPVRINLFIRNLYLEPEEAGFAKIELAKSGAAVVPYMIEEMLRRPEAERLPILDLLAVLGHDTVRPLLAALDINDNILRENLLDVLLRRKDLFVLKGKGIDVTPALWPLASTLNKSEAVRRKARKILTIVYDLRSADHLPLPLHALTEEAERYYYHRVRFEDPQRVRLWRFDGKKVMEDSSFTATKAEETLGLHFAKLALQLDPTYRPAQLVMVGLLIDKGYQGQSPDRPLGTLRPTVEDLLLTLSPDLLNAALEGGLRDERLPIILSSIKAMGKLGDVRSLTPETQGEPALIRALQYGDRRVQMSAVDGILRIPGAASTQATTRIVEILKTALVPDFMAAIRPRVLVASASDPYLREVAAGVEFIGFEPVLSFSGRQAIKRLLSRADIDAVLLDARLPDPGLSWVMAQLRADQGLRRLPVFVSALPDSAVARDVLDDLREAQLRAKTLDEELGKRVEDRLRLEKVNSYAAARAGEDLVVTDQRKQRALLTRRIQYLSDRYDQEATRREEVLRKHMETLKHVWVLASSQVADARQLAARFDERMRDAGMQPLSKTERTEYVEMALGWLAKMAVGEVKGFDVRPAEQAVVNMLTAPGLSEPAMLNAIKVLGRLTGAGAQRHLIAVFLDEKRTVPVRVTAADELLRHMQEYGKPGLEQQRVLLDVALVASKQAGIDPALRDRMTRMIGALRPGQKTTGQRLRDFVP